MILAPIDTYSALGLSSRNRDTERDRQGTGLRQLARVGIATLRPVLSPNRGATSVGKKPKQTTTGHGDRIAPDPLSIVLPALSALGAIASIATINWAAEDHDTTHTGSKRKTTMALRDLESCCLGLTDIFGRLQRNAAIFSGESAFASLPLKFGVHGPRIDAQTAKIFQQLANDIASMQVLAVHNSFAAMTAIEDGEIEAPDDVYFGFGEQQERLNDLLIKRPALKQVIEAGGEVADKLTLLVRQLKSCQVTKDAGDSRDRVPHSTPSAAGKS